MRPFCHLTVEGADPRHLALDRLEALEELVRDLGAEAYPFFLRIAASLRGSLQPVACRSLLQELLSLTERMQAITVPCLLFRGRDGALLGGMYAPPSRSPQVVAPRGVIRIFPTPDGIRAVAAQLPPPVGFRSTEGLASGHYECYVERIERRDDGYLGWRTKAMGGSGAPVALPGLHLPPVTQWDFAHVHGKPAVARVDLATIPFAEAFADVLHGLRSACEDSLRLKMPLEYYRD